MVYVIFLKKEFAGLRVFIRSAQGNESSAIDLFALKPKRWALFFGSRIFLVYVIFLKKEFAGLGFFLRSAQGNESLEIELLILKQKK